MKGGSEIRYPSDATFSADWRGIVGADGELITNNTVIISPNDEDAIHSVPEQPESPVLYDLQGRMVQNPRQAGVYVSKGRKMVKEK